MPPLDAHAKQSGATSSGFAAVGFSCNLDRNTAAAKVKPDAHVPQSLTARSDLASSIPSSEDKVRIQRVSPCSGGVARGNALPLSEGLRAISMRQPCWRRRSQRRRQRNDDTKSATRWLPRWKLLEWKTSCDHRRRTLLRGLIEGLAMWSRTEDVCVWSQWGSSSTS
jgi:hypothetical protein